MSNHFRGVLCMVLLSGLLSWLMITPALANNLDISNVSLEERNITDNTLIVEFDISWSNSWRDTVNHDAVWVFFKLDQGGTSWDHVNVKCKSGGGRNPTDFDAGTNSLLESYVPDDGTAQCPGIFIRRKGDGSGHITSRNMRIKLDTSGVTGLTAIDLITIRVFGVEMVYIPQGSFVAGTDQNFGVAAFVESSVGGGGDTGWAISSEALIIADSDISPYFLYTAPSVAHGKAYATEEIFSIPAEYPKGYQAFYTMKYELTERQYVDFLETLTDTQQAARDLTNTDSGGKNSDTTINRNTISGATNTAYTTTRPDRAVGYLRWPDLAAYLDWAGLRPMTELEYEKMTGPDTFPWGEDAPTSMVYFDKSFEDGTEHVRTVLNGAGTAAVYDSLTYQQGDGSTGPGRSGLFARSNSTQKQAGASKYGVMELAGNLQEIVVSIGDTYGTNFIGSHGDGTIDSNGRATALNWPSEHPSGVNSHLGSGTRGGGWDSDSLGHLYRYSRTLAVTDSGLRNRARGGRGVRTCASCL